MLQPRSYPEFVAKALVLDNDPFESMVDDDNPWIEGLVLVTSVSLLAGIALAIGNFLTAATLPDPNAVLTTLLQGWSQVAATASIPAAEGEEVITALWWLFVQFTGYAGGWSSILPIFGIPGFALVWWLFFSLASFGIARLFGGNGSLSATFGAAALTVAPLVFLLVSVIPFAGVSAALLSVWTILIGYRAVHVSQELPWRSAAITTGIVYAVAIVLLIVVVLAFTAGFSAGGYR